MFKLFILLFSSTLLGGLPAKADFGDASFPVDMFQDGPKSYHDAWCRKLKQECRVRFQGPAMFVEGQGGIQISQLIRYRYDESGGEYYNYIAYKSRSGQPREALFLFVHRDAQREFIRAFARWKRQESQPIPNFLFPASQGPQETHGRDGSFGVPMNPYERPKINDWNQRTTPVRRLSEDSKKGCDKSFDPHCR